MSAKKHGRESLHIEIFVDLSPGSLSVQSYSDTPVDTLGKAINEAQRFIYACRRLKRHIDRHGLGATPSSQVPANVSSIASEALGKLFERAGEGPRPVDNVFSSSALFESLTRKG